MKKFDLVYIRLTAWYVAIIMIISLLFSVWVYAQSQLELRLSFSGVESTVKTNSVGLPLPNYKLLLENQLQKAQGRLIMQLTLLNLGVFIAGSVASYWLARRTLRPIEEAVDAKERFTADASHELRTPLTAMKAEIEVGLRDKNISKQDAVKLLKSNLEEIDRLSGLADGLLALTQSDTVPTTAPINLKDTIDKVSKQMQPIAQAKNITLTDESQPLIVRGEELAVEKIIGILVDNAIKYSPPKTVVTISTHQKADKVYLKVKDQGIGIRSSELPHIFDRFYRADTSRSKLHVAGNGLGLSIAQKLAQAIHAHISVTSKVGVGSIFTVCFNALKQPTN